MIYVNFIINVDISHSVFVSKFSDDDDDFSRFLSTLSEFSIYF